MCRVSHTIKFQIQVSHINASLLAKHTSFSSSTSLGETFQRLDSKGECYMVKISSKKVFQFTFEIITFLVAGPVAFKAHW